MTDGMKKSGFQINIDDDRTFARLGVTRSNGAGVRMFGLKLFALSDPTTPSSFADPPLRRRGITTKNGGIQNNCLRQTMSTTT